MSIRLLIILILLFLAACLADADEPYQPVRIEARAIWVDAGSIPTNDQAMAEFVDSLAAANLNILLPEVVRRGYTIYPSKLDEQDPKWKDYDPLAALIREAHARGMEVHPWVWVFRQGYSKDMGPIFRAHPEWMAVNKWGETLSANGGYWICPSIPEARDYLVSLFKELITNYDVDGLHLDYIRYETQSPTPYCYNDSCVEQFKTKYDVNPFEIDPLTEMQVTWHLWREDLINTFVQRISCEILTIKPQVCISAAVGSLPDEARKNLLQNWPHWIDNKWLDFIVPMSYINDNSKFRNMVTLEKNAVDSRTILVPGLGLHLHKDMDNTLQQIELARELETDGTALFASVYLKDDLRKALAAGPFPKKSEIPFRKPEEHVKTLIEAALVTFKSMPGLASQYLSQAERLLKYIEYQTKDVGYIEPSRPPIFIPETVLPIPTVEVAKAVSCISIDGRLDDPTWAMAAQIKIANTEMGDPAPVETTVRLAYDDTNLYIAYTAMEPQMSSLKETVTKRDGPVFYDDSLEFFLDTTGKRRDYYHLALNTLNTQFDAKINDVSANLTWKSACIKNIDGWTAEVAIPFASLGIKIPNSGDVWTGNFARNRWITGKPEYLIWSVPYGGFHSPGRFGSITFQ